MTERRRWRTGRHNKQIIYRQLGDQPSKEDRLMLVAFLPEEAAAIVEILNAAEPDHCMVDFHTDPHQSCILR